MANSTTAEKKSSKRITPTASTNGRRLPSTTSSSAIPDTMPTAGPFQYFPADFTRSSDEPRHTHPFSIVFLFRFGNRCRQHLVDATSVEINDFETPTIPCVQASLVGSRRRLAHRGIPERLAPHQPRVATDPPVVPGAGHPINSE